MHFGFNNQFSKSQENIGQNFKNNKKFILFCLVLGITNLYVKHIPHIKKVFFCLLTT
jgi:hypothetical protein